MEVDPGHDNEDQNLAVILCLMPNILLQQCNTTAPSPNIKLISNLLNENYSCASQHHQKIARAPQKCRIDKNHQLTYLQIDKCTETSIFFSCSPRSYIQEEAPGDACLRAQRQINAANSEEQVEVEEIKALFIARARGLGCSGIPPT